MRSLRALLLSAAARTLHPPTANVYSPVQLSLESKCEQRKISFIPLLQSNTYFPPPSPPPPRPRLFTGAILTSPTKSTMSGCNKQRTQWHIIIAKAANRTCFVSHWTETAHKTEVKEMNVHSFARRPNLH